LLTLSLSRIGLGTNMAADPKKVELLVNHLSESIELMVKEEDASASDVMSALFTILDTLISGVRRVEAAEERQHNATQINQMLLQLMVEHNKKPF